ncbi:tetratricopeptide repeat protein [Psychrosphaera sp. 1_MG-2023]|uniref:tetratricopeptide repeat protein n=1 Tax=Psychrosphaera sp. 1_MG-2023 TaxID=3062643 RepID=UPI0026E1CC56|nr:tetratricopeptide repeat protein [Psychrosphaera sp. 1_MG-2023]MDO6721327.1 tetratricopeptide repeat protein [Psychrosphaera sp. 1_MG-2023]
MTISKTKSPLYKALTISLLLGFSGFSAADVKQDFQQAFTNFSNFAKAGDLQASLPHGKKVYELSKELYNEQSPSRIAAAENYAFVLKQLSKDKDAEKVYIDLIQLKEKKFGKHSKELILPLSDVAGLALDKEKTADYQTRYEKLYLRHNSSQFVPQLLSNGLPSAPLAEKVRDKMSQSYGSEIKIVESPHWTLVAVGKSKKFAKNASKILENSYESLLGFSIAIDMAPAKLEEKMTAVYFESPEQQRLFMQKSKWARNKIAIMVINKNGKAFPGTAIARNATRLAGFITGLEKRVKGKPTWAYRGLYSSFQFGKGNQEYGPHTNNYNRQQVKKIETILSREDAPNVHKIVSYTGSSLPWLEKSQLETYYPFLIRYLYQYYPNQLAAYLTEISSKNSKSSGPSLRATFEDAFGDISAHEAPFKQYLQTLVNEL